MGRVACSGARGEAGSAVVQTGRVWWWLLVLVGEVRGFWVCQREPQSEGSSVGVRDDVRVFTPSSWGMGGLFLRLGGWGLEGERLGREGE